MNKPPLSRYVIGVLITWIVILCAIWFLHPAEFFSFGILFLGFVLGMIAMYIAVHMYQWK